MQWCQKWKWNGIEWRNIYNLYMDFQIIYQENEEVNKEIQWKQKKKLFELQKIKKRIRSIMLRQSRVNCKIKTDWHSNCEIDKGTTTKNRFSMNKIHVRAIKVMTYNGQEMFILHFLGIRNVISAYCIWKKKKRCYCELKVIRIDLSRAYISYFIRFIDENLISWVKMISNGVHNWYESILTIGRRRSTMLFDIYIWTKKKPSPGKGIWVR